MFRDYKKKMTSTERKERDEDTRIRQNQIIVSLGIAFQSILIDEDLTIGSNFLKSLSQYHCFCKSTEDICKVRFFFYFVS